MNEDLFDSKERRILVRWSPEALGQVFNLPPGARITGIAFDQTRNQFVMGVVGFPCGTIPPAAALTLDLRIDHIPHHVVNWPEIGYAEGSEPTLTGIEVRNPDILNFGQALAEKEKLDQSEAPIEDASEYEEDKTKFIQAIDRLANLDEPTEEESESDA